MMVHMFAESQAATFALYFSNTVHSAVNLGGFHNHVYLVKGDSDFVLRVSTAQHRSLGATGAEVDFLRYLAANGASVARPLQGLDGRFVYECQQEGCSWVITAFSVARGRDWRNRGSDEGDRLIRIGKTIGKIHRLSRAYQPTGHRLRRQWHESQHMAKAEALLRHYDPRLAGIFQEYLGEMKRLPQDGAGFGLIHGDYLFSNYHVDGNDVIVFDFDECEYSWFMYDIAVCMYYYLLGGNPSELPGKTQEAEEMLCHLLRGYLQENEMDVFWIKNIDLFFQMREFVLLSTTLERFSGTLEGWQKSFFEGAVDRRLNHRPFIKSSFDRACNILL